MLNLEIAIPRSLVLSSTLGSRRIVRSGLLLLLLAGELSHLGIPLLSYLNPTLRGLWWTLIWNGRPLAEAVIGSLLVAVFLSWPTFRTAFADAIHEAQSNRLNSWLGFHLLCVGLVAMWLDCGMQGGTFSAVGGALWFFAGLVVLPLTAITWSATIMPFIFWTRWLARSPGALAIGALVGILTRSIGYFVQMLWPPLCHYTFVIVELLLHALGLSVVSDPGRGMLGTARFVVWIAPACSGLEGIALICVFIAAYLRFYSTEYRFPVALLLIPAGIASIWILNAVRITALILIGQWYGDIAMTGFHSVAGWIFFNLVAFGIVGASRHVGWLARDDDADLSREDFRAPNPALPYLIPLLVTMGTAMLTAPFADGFDAVYPVQVIVAAFALWWYRGRIAVALAGFSWMSVALGVLCFLLWTTLTHPDHNADAAIASHLRSLPSATLLAWMMFRLAGAIITVPITEELAFRGYLLRKFIASDFESVSFDNFTWSSFVISTVAFGALHKSWIAGVLAGGLFALSMYRRGRLADAIAAHAAANALLAIYVITTGYWSLWA